MALFSKGERRSPKAAQDGPDTSGARPVMGREANCRICDARREFTRCWLRVVYVTQCDCCGLTFENPSALYRPFQPACPRCGEYLEQPGFEYGLCDGCGSKYELVTGTKPGLLPNKAQRAEMEKLGRVWRQE